MVPLESKPDHLRPPKPWGSLCTPKGLQDVQAWATQGAGETSVLGSATKLKGSLKSDGLEVCTETRGMLTANN
jgi:hypothetical protein